MFCKTAPKLKFSYCNRKTDHPKNASLLGIIGNWCNSRTWYKFWAWLMSPPLSRKVRENYTCLIRRVNLRNHCARTNVGFRLFCAINHRCHRISLISVYFCMYSFSKLKWRSYYDSCSSESIPDIEPKSPWKMTKLN